MIHMATYEELDKLIAAFGNDYLNMVVIVAGGGLGKSQNARDQLPDNEVVALGGHVTPLRLYELLYEGRNKKVVFDEIDGLLSNTQHVGLLKQLCETRKMKKITWMSKDKRALEIDGGLGHFYTSSRVLMLCNSIDIYNANVSALFSRALAVRFRPTAIEILDRMKTFASDCEIVAYLDQFHDCIQGFSLRTYGILEELKGAGMDWRKYALDESTPPPKILEIANLLANDEPDVERIRKYSGSRRDYYNWKPQTAEYIRRQSLKTIKREGDECDHTSIN